MRTSSGKILLVAVTLLALIIEVPRDTFGQLEAVGAVLSVVPVTSILATAGLVGVKLAAMSRLLNVLGYDRAYLAQNLGTGTAASPIGLQTRYAYMFPYVPGVNISVKGEDSIGMPKETVAELSDIDTKTQSQNGVSFGEVSTGTNKQPSRRKPFPSMILPANYEHQAGPFRGREALKEIFDTAGLQAHFPTMTQQQQLQQQFNLPQQGKDLNQWFEGQQQQRPPQSDNHLNMHSDLYNDNDPNRNDKQHQPHAPLHVVQQQQTYQDKPSATLNNNYNDNNNQQQQIDGPPQPKPDPSISNLGTHAFIPSNVAPNRQPESNSGPAPPLMDGAAMTDVVGSGLSMATASNSATLDHGEQPEGRPSSSSFHQIPAPKQQQSTNSNQNRSPPGRDQMPASATATQVNMPHPHYNQHLFNPDNSQRDGSATGSLSGLLSRPEEVQAQRGGDTGGDSSVWQPADWMPASVRFSKHAAIPQRELFSLWLRQQRQRQRQTHTVGQHVPLPMGHLSAPAGPAMVTKPESMASSAPIHAVQLITDAVRQPSLESNSPVPDHFKPNWINRLMSSNQDSSRDQDELRASPLGVQLIRPEQQQQRRPPARPTVASLGAGFSPFPNEMTSTNFFPRPFDTDDSPTLIGDQITELDRTQPNHRRKKRSPYPAAFPQNPDPVLINNVSMAQQVGGARQAPSNSQQRSASNGPEPPSRPGRFFGMPVSNINTLRRRRRQVSLLELASRSVRI